MFLRCRGFVNKNCSSRSKIFPRKFRTAKGKRRRTRRSVPSDLVAVWKFFDSSSLDKKVTSRRSQGLSLAGASVTIDCWEKAGEFSGRFFPRAKNVRIFFGFFLIRSKVRFVLCARTKTHTHTRTPENSHKRTHTGGVRKREGASEGPRKSPLGGVSEKG